MPEREFVERMRPLASTYKLDFMSKTGKKQLIVERPLTSFEGAPTTTYRYTHFEEAPNKKAIDAMNNTALKPSLLNRKDKPMSGRNSHGRESVASCLTWVSYKSERKDEPIRPTIPAATQTTVYEPHPPTTQKPLSPTSPPRVLQQAWAAPDAPPPQIAPPPMAEMPIQMQQPPPPPVQAPPPQPEPMAQ